MNNLANEIEIINNWSLQNPTVSICCATYNHLEYIERCIQGFLIQKTKFPFEIIIRDDASTDGTIEIIQKYQKLYPTIIRIQQEKENQFSLGIKPAEYFFACSNANYIAWCDGDDYWIDPYKLQKQISFLEDNKDFVMVGHDVINIDEGNNEWISTDFYKRDGSAKDLLLSNVYAPTATRTHRHLIKKLPVEFKRVLHGDMVIASILGRYGKYKYLDDILPSVRNIHPCGVASGVSTKRKYEDQSITFFWLYRYYLRMGAKRIATKHFSKYVQWSKKRFSVAGAEGDEVQQLIILKQKLGDKKLLSVIDGRSLVFYGIPKIFKAAIKKIFFIR